MTALRSLATGLALVLAAAITAHAVDNLVVEIEGRVIRTTRGEQRTVSMMSGPLVIGKTTTAVISQHGCGLGVKGFGGVDSGANAGWTADVTPEKSQDEAVTFRVRWTRARDTAKDTAPPRGDLQLTLHAGESAPLDMIPIASPPNQDCTGAVLRVGVGYWPLADDDRRLLTTDLWLIERLPNGAERNQLPTVRGSYNQSTPFYFDTIADAGSALDFFGDFTILAEGDVMVIKLDTRSRLVTGGVVDRDSRTLPLGGNRFGSRQVESALRLKPNDVADVELPRLSENQVGAFANRRYSIRVRTRQIR